MSIEKKVKSRLGKTALAAYERWREAMRWQRELDRELKQFELTHTQLLVLSALDVVQRDEPDAEGVPQVDIALEAGVDPVTTSRILRRFEERSLVEFDAYSEDERIYAVILRAEGRELLGDAATVAERVATKVAMSKPTPRRRTRRTPSSAASG